MIETAQAFGVDIGGSGIKAAPVNLEKGEFAQPRLKILTPEHSTPKAVFSRTDEAAYFSASPLPFGSWIWPSSVFGISTPS